MVIDTEDLVAVIDTLNEKSQRELRDRLEYLLEKRDDGRYLIEHLHAWEAMRGVSDDVKNVPPIQVFASKYGKAKLMAAFDAMNDYATKSCGKQLTQSERLAVLRLMAECHAEHLRSVETHERKRMVIRPLSLLRNLASLPMAVDMCFPGYSASRMLDRVALLKAA